MPEQENKLFRSYMEPGYTAIHSTVTMTLRADMTTKPTYVIYEVVSLKVGCTTKRRLEQRIKENRALHGEAIEVNVLEELPVGSTIAQASAAEKRWALSIGIGFDGKDYADAVRQAKNGARAAMAKGAPQYDLEFLKRVGRLGLARSHVSARCPHCGKSGQFAIMKRWHFDNCKQF